MFAGVVALRGITMRVINQQLPGLLPELSFPVPGLQNISQDAVATA